MNYAKETIPDPQYLVQKSQNLIEQIEEYPKYQFLDLFTEVDRASNTEYHRNNSIWEDKIKYNTWVKNEYEEEQKPLSEQRNKNEVKGIYIFYKNDEAVYVGISRKILRRLKNHFLGTTHSEASLVYLMLRDEYDNDKNKKYDLYKGTRADFQLFKDKRGETQTCMRANWKIAIIPIEDNYEMYLTELLIACKLKTKWNTFETH